MLTFQKNVAEQKQRSRESERFWSSESGADTPDSFLTRRVGVIKGWGAAKGLRNRRDSFAKTILVTNESLLASSEQMRRLLKTATGLRPHMDPIGDEKQLGSVEAGKPFAQLRPAAWALTAGGRP